ncbi:Mu transposase C-terminal domain-containing protein [Rhizobium sp. 2YAF20]|uniref:Mu transposase C-terminal domain-containing protein n=1 Tax=Rhizobium sp. 2YAF20 TaxID=3233027 RepID=UPI003F9DA7A9
MNYYRRLDFLKVELSSQDRLVFDGRFWVSTSMDTKGHNLECETIPGMCRFVDHKTLSDALKENKARVIYGYHHPVQSKLRRLFGKKRLNEFKDDFVALARHKELLIHSYEEYCQDHKKPTRALLAELLDKWNEAANAARRKTVGKVNKKVEKRSSKATKQATFDPPNTRTFLDYYDDYLSADRDIRILLPRHRGPGKNHRLHTLDAESLGWSQRFALMYLDDRKPTMSGLREACIASIYEENARRQMLALELKQDSFERLTPPSRKQFEKLIKDLDAYEVMAAREGRNKALAIFRAQQTGFDVDRPGQHVEFDGYMLEVQSWLSATDLWDHLSNETKEKLAPVRIYLSMARDAWTGYLLAIKSAMSENSSTVIDTLDMAIADKCHIARYVGAQTDWYGGVRIQNAYTDNGTAYIADATHDAFREAGVALSHPPAGQPWHRGFIESILSVISRQLLTNFHGRTFGNVVEKGNYKPSEQATLTAEEILCLIIRLILDNYHHKPNWRTGKSPHDAWVDYLESSPVYWGGDPEMRITVFGVHDDRTIKATGIVVWGIRYNSIKLQQLFQKVGSQKVEIRYHDDDLRWISVKGPDGWFLVENRIQMTEQVTRDEWIEVWTDIKLEAQIAQEEMLPRMYRGLNDVRSTVDAARKRARLAPSTATRDDLKQLERDLFNGVELSADDDDDFALVPIAAPSGPLRQGGVDMTRPKGTIPTPKSPKVSKIKAKEKKYDEGNYR